MMTSSASDKYECAKFSEEKKAFLLKELNENTSQVNAHIESFRRWVKSMAHIQCPTDANFLLQFLRVSKFDHEKAQKRLDNFCTTRSSPRGSQEFFQYPQGGDSTLEAFLNAKFIIPLGRINSEELIILCRFQALNSLTFTKQQLAQFIFMTMDVVIEDENNQIYGVKSLSDLQDVDRRVYELIADTKVIKKIYQAWQDSYPFRIKGQLFCNAPPIFDILFRIIHFFMNSKMRSRTSKIPDDMGKVMEMIPGIEKILPKEYNGHGGSLDECAERWKKQFKQYYANDRRLSSIHIDESKRPKETLTYLTDLGDYVGETYGTEGTYTKFEAF